MNFGKNIWTGAVIAAAVATPSIALAVPITYYYSYSMSTPGMTTLEPGKYFDIYNKPGGGMFGYDIARCHADRDEHGVFLRAFNHDSASPTPVWGTPVYGVGCSEAIWGPYIVRCCFD